MFKLNDFIHLPQLDPLVRQMVTGGPGLALVAGLDPRPEAGAAAGIPLPSGRTTIFTILLHEIMEAYPGARAVYVTQNKANLRIDRRHRRRFELREVDANFSYAHQIKAGVVASPDLLVIDRLSAETAPLAAWAAHFKIRVLSQIDTALRGSDLTGELVSLGVPAEEAGSLKSVLAVQRLPALCKLCRQPISAPAGLLERLGRQFPHLSAALEDLSGSRFYSPGSCTTCGGSGRYGDIAVFDAYLAPEGPGEVAQITLEEYVLRLASLGHLALEDLFQLQAEQFRSAYTLLSASERSLRETNQALERKLAELGSAHEVLLQRTRVLISLETLSQHMVASTSLGDLGGRLCRQAAELCGADRAVLYFWKDPASEELEAGLDERLEEDSQAEVLAVSGWNPGLVHLKLDRDLVCTAGREPRPFSGRPPGLPPGSGEQGLRAGMVVPLAAQDRQVGLMIVQSTQKNSFEPSEVALLRTLANQAALGIQRTGLIEALRRKIDQLEAAQVELVKKERLDRELELARQMQLSMLPRTFLDIPEYTFAARYQPARQVGGDFYDVIDLDEDHFGLVIADVSDKGLSSALFMALTRSLLRAEARREPSPCQVLKRVNRVLQEMAENSKFVAVFYGIVERSTRRLAYVRAGHDHPVLLRQGEVHTLGGHGAVLGILDEDELHLSEETLDLLGGDRLVLFTDGLVDVLDGDGQFLEVNRLMGLFQAHAKEPARQFCDSIFAGLARFQAGTDQFDDMSLLVLDLL